MVDYHDQKIIDKLVTARIALLLKHPFFGNLATRLKLVNADDWCPTAGTRDAIVAHSARISARFKCALGSGYGGDGLGGGYGGDDSRALGVSAVVSEVTARHAEPNGARVAAAAAWRRLA